MVLDALRKMWWKDILGRKDLYKKATTADR